MSPHSVSTLLAKTAFPIRAATIRTTLTRGARPGVNIMEQDLDVTSKKRSGLKRYVTPSFSCWEVSGFMNLYAFSFGIQQAHARSAGTIYAAANRRVQGVDMNRLARRHDGR